MIVFIQKLSELGSDRSKDGAVSPWRLSIFLRQGNISKPVGPTVDAGLHRQGSRSHSHCEVSIACEGFL